MSICIVESPRLTTVEFADDGTGGAYPIGPGRETSVCVQDGGARGFHCRENREKASALVVKKNKIRWKRNTSVVVVVVVIVNSK